MTRWPRECDLLFASPGGDTRIYVDLLTWEEEFMIKRNIFLMLGAAVLLGFAFVLLALGSSQANICVVAGYQYRVCGSDTIYFVLGTVNTIVAFVMIMFIKERT